MPWHVEGASEIFVECKNRNKTWPLHSSGSIQVGEEMRMSAISTHSAESGGLEKEV